MGRGKIKSKIKLKGLQWGLIFAFVVGLFLLFIGLDFLMKARNADVGWDILSNWRPGGGPAAQVIEGGATGTIEIIGEGDRPVTSTEVGCNIANEMRGDFILNGEKDHGTNLQDKTGYGDSRLIGVGQFEIKWNQAKGKYWTSADLAPAQKDGLKKACSDTGTLIDCKEHLDEACAAAVLSNMKTSQTGVKMCGQVVADGKPVSFGDSNCGSSVSPDWAGGANCAAWCPSADRVVWEAIGGEFGSNDPYYTSDSSFAGNNFVPVCKDIGGSAACEPGYAYLLYWNKKDKKYKVEIAKIPRPKEVRNYMYSVGSQLGGLFAEHDRDRGAAVEHPELRQKANIFVIPTESYSLPTFVNQNFRNAAGKIKVSDEVTNQDIKMEIKSCQGDACFRTSLEKVSYKDSKEGGCGDDCGDELACKENPWPSRKESIRTVYVQTNMDQNGNFEPNHRYQIILNDWRRTWHDGGWTLCRKDNKCYTGLGPAGYCVGKGSKEWGDVAHTVKDFSLVIYDHGEILPDLTGTVQWPAHFAAGQRTTISVKVKNTGLKRAEAFKVTLMADDNKVADSGVPSLAENGEQTVSFSWTPVLGARTLKVVADSAGAVRESDEENNEEARDISVEGADVFISGLDITPSVPTEGQLVRIRFRLENPGSGDQNVNVNFSVSGEEKERKNIFVGSRDFNTTDAKFEWIATAAGNFELAVQADPDNEIAEADETNNEAKKTIAVLAARPVSG